MHARALVAAQLCIRCGSCCPLCSALESAGAACACSFSFPVACSYMTGSTSRTVCTQVWVWSMGQDSYAGESIYYQFYCTVWR